jgi:Tfp pilus assembly protein PilV
MLNRKKYGLRGVSLVEVLVALFIMTVVGAAILAGTYVNIKSTGAAREGILAEGLAKSELEYVKAVAKVATNWTNGSTGIADQANGYFYTIPGAAPSWDTTHTSPFDTPSVYATREYAGYTVTIKIDCLSACSDPVRKVTASVKNSQGITEATIETYVVSP